MCERVLGTANARFHTSVLLYEGVPSLETVARTRLAAGNVVKLVG